MWVQLCWFTPAPSQHLSTFPKVVYGLVNTCSAYQRQDTSINIKKKSFLVDIEMKFWTLIINLQKPAKANTYICY